MMKYPSLIGDFGGQNLNQILVRAFESIHYNYVNMKVLVDSPPVSKILNLFISSSSHASLLRLEISICIWGSKVGSWN